MEIRRGGRFTLPMRMILDSNSRILSALFRDVVVLEARPSMVNDRIEYWAVSKHFDLLQYGEIAPEYEALISTFIGAEPEVRWRLVGDGRLLPLVYEDWGRPQE